MPRRRRRTTRGWCRPSTSTVGSQITFESQACEPRKTAGSLLPVHAIERSRQAQAAILVRVAAGVEHPVEPVRLPDRRLAQPFSSNDPGSPSSRIGFDAQLLPVDAIGGPRHAQPLRGCRGPAPCNRGRNTARCAPRRGRPRRISSQLPYTVRWPAPRGRQARSAAVSSGPATYQYQHSALPRSAPSRWRRCSDLPRSRSRRKQLALLSASGHRRRRWRARCARCGRRSRNSNSTRPPAIANHRRIQNIARLPTRRRASAPARAARRRRNVNWDRRRKHGEG